MSELASKHDEEKKTVKKQYSSNLAVSLLRGNIKSFLASGYFCRLLIAFANSLDKDQD